MEVAAYLEADAESFELLEPGEGPLLSVHARMAAAPSGLTSGLLGRPTRGGRRRVDAGCGRQARGYAGGAQLPLVTSPPVSACTTAKDEVPSPY